MINILGGGWYGCHLAVSLLRRKYPVTLWEKSPALFSGASGANPARLHMGFHYPRNRATRMMCLEHHQGFMATYGKYTRTIPTNIYAVAADDSRVDFGTYCQILKPEVEFVTLERPEELGLRQVEGAILTGERHIVIAMVRARFAELLDDHAVFELSPPPSVLEHEWVIDCTFCANDAQAIDRFEPCVVGLLEGPVDRAVTIMDGPFPSIYPWDEREGLSSLSSAEYTPLARCKTYQEAREVLAGLSVAQVAERCALMLHQMRRYWPDALELYQIRDSRLAIRAMPLSGSDSRLVDLVQMGPRHFRVRAGKIDAVLYAEKLVCEVLNVGGYRP